MFAFREEIYTYSMVHTPTYRYWVTLIARFAFIRCSTQQKPFFVLVPVLYSYVIAANYKGPCKLSGSTFINYFTQPDLLLLLSTIQPALLYLNTRPTCIFFITFIFYHWVVVKPNHYMTHFSSYASTVL
jgi:hypothetical protein